MPMIFDLFEEQDTLDLAAELALFLSPGDVVFLSGDLGAGKTTFARHLIQNLSGSSELEVPSPSFTLVQLYDDARMPVAHLDLYRLKSDHEADELGIEDLLKDHLLVIEWPENAQAHLPSEFLQLTFEYADNRRTVELSGEGAGALNKIARFEKTREFCQNLGIDHAQRQFLQGDASSRRYELINDADQPALLMDMPAQPDGPAIRSGLSYSALAHLATDISAVAAVTGLLREKGISAPEIHAIDLENGLALIEDLGDQPFGKIAREHTSISEEMSAAVSLLAEMAAMPWPNHAEAAPGVRHTIAPYDLDVLLIEAELLLDWFWPNLVQTPAPEEARARYRQCWQALYPLLSTTSPVWVLRDFHSPNLIWLPGRQGIARVGVIDTQDCLLGHPAYDLVSLLQDARIDVPLDVETEQLDFYCAYRSADDDQFDEDALRTAYAILGAQRACKILGIFVRLAKRDHKQAYLQHLPRVARALQRNLKHPALDQLSRWFDEYLPQARQDRDLG